MTERARAKEREYDDGDGYDVEYFVKGDEEEFD